MCFVIGRFLMLLFITVMFTIAAYYIFRYLSDCQKRNDYYSETAENRINYSNNSSYKFKVNFDD